MVSLAVIPPFARPPPREPPRRVATWSDAAPRPPESDSDSEVDRPGNRGNKLKKRARFVREGQLAPTGGPSSYREVRCPVRVARARG